MLWAQNDLDVDAPLNPNKQTKQEGVRLTKLNKLPTKMCHSTCYLTIETRQVTTNGTQKTHIFFDSCSRSFTCLVFYALLTLA